MAVGSRVGSGDGYGGWGVEMETTVLEQQLKNVKKKKYVLLLTLI